MRCIACNHTYVSPVCWQRRIRKMFTCPANHPSETPEFCSVCGLEIPGTAPTDIDVRGVWPRSSRHSLSAPPTAGDGRQGVPRLRRAARQRSAGVLRGLRIQLRDARRRFRSAASLRASSHGERTVRGIGEIARQSPADSANPAVRAHPRPFRRGYRRRQTCRANWNRDVCRIGSFRQHRCVGRCCPLGVDR